MLPTPTISAMGQKSRCACAAAYHETEKKIQIQTKKTTKKENDFNHQHHQIKEGKPLIP